MEEAAADLTFEDIEIIAYVTAKVNTQLQRMRKKYSSPKEYGKKMAALIDQKDKVAACLLLYDFKNLEPEKLYKPEEFREIVTKQNQMDRSNDTADIVTALEENNHQNEDMDYKVMNKALHELRREIGLINIRGKEKIKKIKGKQKITLSGNPSVYKLPSAASELKNAMSKPRVVELIIRSLKRLGLLDNLAFLLEGSFHAIRYSMKDDATSNTLINIGIKGVDIPGVKVDFSEWESYGTRLLFLEDIQLRYLANQNFTGKFCYQHCLNHDS